MRKLEGRELADGRAVIWDFDGVIGDSSREAFVTSTRIWRRAQPCSRLVGDVRWAVADSLPRPEQVGLHPLYQAFMGLMPLGNRAEDFGVALAAIDRGLELPDQAAYDAFRASLGESWLAEFHRLFYQERSLLRAQDPAGWRGLQRPYRPVVEALRRNASRVAVAIATAKDRDSVLALLDDYGLSGVFREDLIADKETGLSKQAHLRALRLRLGLPWSALVFVDDKVNHLDDVSTLGVRGILAAWGYNGKREHDLARARGHTVLSLADLASGVLL
jgi:phosphoglycolate phosphatase-like HAD superfamily hydrolase